LAARSEEAAARLSQALRFAPDHPAAHYRLALALADLDRHDEALKHYARAVRLQPEVDTSPTLHHFLAEGYAQGRRFRDALRHEERALYLARQQRDPALVKKIEETLAAYRRLAKPVQ
jgi:tetratricopeptide (TPR) repeat protein